MSQPRMAMLCGSHGTRARAWARGVAERALAGEDENKVKDDVS